MHALITAGVKGVGKELCLHLSEKGFDVVILYHRSIKEASSLVESIKTKGKEAEMVQVDFSSYEGVVEFCKSYKKKYSKLKVLINNWGSYSKGALSTLKPEEFLHTFHSNLFVPFLLIRELLEEIKENKGSIINLGICGLHSLKADTYFPAYSMAKLALLQLTRSFGKELAGENVNVNMISPGYLEDSVDHPSSFEKLPMRRKTEYKEILKALDFFLENPHVTGQNIDVSGGVRL